MRIRSHHFMANRWGNSGNNGRHYFGGSKITVDGDCSHEIKTLTPWKESYDQPRQHIKKQRHYFAKKGPSSQGSGFPSGHVWMWEVDYKESWVLKNWCFWSVVLEKTLQSPLDCKEISPECSLGGLMLKLKLQYFGHLMWRDDSFEKTLKLGKTEGRRRRGWKRMRWLDVLVSYNRKKESKMVVAKRQKNGKTSENRTKEGLRTGVRISGKTNSPPG